MAFSFGAPTAPAPAPTPASATPAPAFSFGGTAASTNNNTNAPTTGGFTFGGNVNSNATSNVSTTTATAPGPTTGGAGAEFSFSTTTNTATPSTSVATDAYTTATATVSNTPAPAGTFSFATGTSSAATSSASATTANTATAAAAATTSQAEAKAVGTVPTFEAVFPYLGINTQIEHILNTLHEYYLNNKDDDSNNNIYHDAHDLHLQGQELIHLLSGYQNDSEQLSSSSSSSPIGKLLSDPLESIFATCRNSRTSQEKKYVPNMTLRQQLISNPTLQFPSSSDTRMFNLTTNTASSSSTNSNTTQVPSSMLNDIFTLSDLLQIPELHAASIYTAIRSCYSSSISVTKSLEKHILGENTTQWFTDRHTRPNRIGGFIKEVIENAKMNNTYVGGTTTTRRSTKDGMKGGEEDVQMKYNHQEEEEEMDYVQMAMDLYFTERSKCLQTILLLIQHRVSVYTSTVINNTHVSSSSSYGDMVSSSSSSMPQSANNVILESTDQLLEANLISNLVLLIREMTLKIDETGKKICMALDHMDYSSNNNSQKQQQQHSMFGGFGPTTTTQSTLGQNAATNNITQVQDVDYAFYEFAIRQRQIAAECLFYLTYHTQCTQNEIVTIIDVLQDLTNGKNKKDTTSGDCGIGSGLPTLDAIRDVPDPYRLSWISSSSSSSSTQSNANFMNGAFSMANTFANPQQQKVEKSRVDWENELVSSLWSVRGLTNATITTLHTDFSGRQMYHATPLGIIEQSCEQMENDNVNRTEVVVDGGLPQLLQCVTTLIISIVCCLDVRNTLIDRKTHGPNSFGVGNALFPPQLSTQNPVDIHESIIGINQRLDPNSARFMKWKRQDIVGLLSAAYALFLRPSTSTFASPQKSPRERSSSSGSGSSNAVYQMFRSCLQIPTITKSLTFARVTLIPSIGMPSTKSSSTFLDNDFSFYISVLSDFTSQYLDALSSFTELPISRAKWMESELQELQVRHVQENQRRQLNAWSGQSYEEVAIPTEVDIFQRPDCLDDIIALAVAVCSTCPMCANRFWSTVETIVENDDYLLELRPSRSLKKLEKIQGKDPSLLPVYLSFLAAISLFKSDYSDSDAMNGATAVYDWLSNSTRISSSPTSYGDKEQTINWHYILNLIRWYTQQLNPPQEESKKESWSNNESNYNQAGSDQPTGYYYGAEPLDDYESSFQQGKRKSTASTSSTNNAPRELDANSSSILMSLLNLLSNVAYKSEQARRQILQIRLAVPGNKRYFIDEDDVLTILFSLLVTSISSELRGMALNAISNLVCSDLSSLPTEEEKNKEIDVVRRCWELLEMSQLIPINKLSQYSFVGLDRTRSILSENLPKSEENWFPPTEENGIVYEMEYIESKAGSYPATEGLLKLLGVLFSSGVAPSNLGCNSRTIPGCSPYIEYVADFVLPRAMGTKNKGNGGLYFFTLSDRSRLFTRALEVINAVLVRYSFVERKVERTQVVPNLITESVPHDKTLVEAKKASNIVEMKDMTKPKSLSLVHDSIYLIDNSNENELYADFEAPNVTSNVSGGDQKAIPSKSKSPGFFILSDLLSSDGSLLNILLQILKLSSVEFDDANRNGQSSGAKSYSLFGDIQPQYSTAKAARDYVLDQQKSDIAAVSLTSIPAQFIETFLTPLLKQNTQNASESNQSTVNCEDEVMWKEHCILLVFRILCAAAGRSADFKHHSNTSQFASRVVPVLNFRHKVHSAVIPLEVKNIQVDNIARLIIKDRSILSLLAFYLSYLPQTLSNECSIAGAALSIINFIEEDILPVDYTGFINGITRNDKDKIAAAYATRLSMIRNAKEHIDHLKIGESILNQTSLYLSRTMLSEENLCLIIMGYSSRSLAERRDFLWQSFQGVDVELCECNNILDAMIELLLDVNFILDPESSNAASKCFEILFHLCTNEESFFQLTRLCTIAKLRRLSFWPSQMLRFLGKASEDSDSILSVILDRSPIQRLFEKDEESIVCRDSNLIHSTSWILKGVAQELHALMGYGIDQEIMNSGDSTILSFTSPQPTKCRDLLKLLLCQPNSVIANTLLSLPLEKPQLARHLLTDAPYQNAIDAATYEMEVPTDICRSYQLVNIDVINRFFESLGNLDSFTNQKDYAIKWAEKWNSYTKFSCASSHLCHSWYLLSQMTFIFCQTSNELDAGFALEMLKLVLHRLNYNGISRGHSSGTSAQFESSNMYHLSSLCPSLVEQIISTDHLMDDDTCHHIFVQLLGAISTCCGSTEIDETLNNKRAAELCCALVSLIDAESFKSFNLLSGPSSQLLYEEAKAVVVYLGRLSVLNIVEMPIQGPGDPKYVSYMARACLASIIGWFDSVERASNCSGDGHFLVDLFASSSSSTVHSQTINDFITTCISLLKVFDDDITDLLEQLACFSCGTELLVNCGISKVLVSISQKFVDDSQMHNVATHTYGSVGVEVPKFLINHFSLFNAMLSTRSSQMVRTSLFSDMLAFLQIHSSNLENLLLGFPKNQELVVIIVSSLCNMSSNGNDERANLGYRNYDWFKRLERNVINLAVHLGNFPLPAKYLSKLPNNLRNALATEKRHYQTSRDLNEKCWWDAVDSKNDNDIFLPEPMMTGIQMNGVREARHWSRSKYEAGIAGSQFVDKCLTYIINLSSHNQEVPLDSLSLASSIYQYYHILNVVNDRMSRLKVEGENDLSNKFSLMMEKGNDSDGLKYFNDIEAEVLGRYFATVQKCLNKFLYLTKKKFQIDDSSLTRKNTTLIIEVLDHVKATEKNLPNTVTLSTALAHELTEICKTY